VLHGFTGNPTSVRGLAEALAKAGFAVELPRLPGHGTAPQDLAATTYADWLAEAERAYGALAARCERVVVAGLSMGGVLTVHLAVEHPEIAGIVAINTPMGVPAELAAAAEAMLEAGTEYIDKIGGDVADPDAYEVAYDATPLAPLLSLLGAGEVLRPRLSEVRCPVLVINSADDHVVPASDADLLAGAVSGPVERLTLERSFHVATIDHDKDLVFERTVDFATRATSP
jgi:carboxylesterase